MMEQKHLAASTNKEQAQEKQRNIIIIYTLVLKKFDFCNGRQLRNYFEKSEKLVFRGRCEQAKLNMMNIGL